VLRDSRIYAAGMMTKAVPTCLDFVPIRQMLGGEHGGNAMKWEFATFGKHYRHAIAATAIALGMNAIAGSAFAQTSTPYQQYVFTQSCSVPCVINFAKVPAGKRLDVTNVSCLLRWNAVANPMYVDNMQLLVVNTNTLVSASNLAPIPTHTMNPQVANSHLTFSANHAVSVFAAAQRNFRAVADTTGGAAANFFACHISGQMVTLAP